MKKYTYALIAFQAIFGVIELFLYSSTGRTFNFVFGLLFLFAAAIDTVRAIRAKGNP